MVPEMWAIKSIKDIANVTSGGTPSKTTLSFWGGDIPWIRTTEVQNRKIYKHDVQEFITEEGLKGSSAKLVPKNTILLAMIGQGKTRGQVALLTFQATTNQNCAAIVLNDEQDPEFYFNYLLSQYKNIRNFSNSAGQSNLSGGLVKSIKVPVPPLPEQKKIARILSTWDKAIETVEALIENSKAQKKALMQQLLTGKRRLPGFDEEWKDYHLMGVAHVLVSPVDKKTIEGEKAVLLCNYTDVYYNIRITKSLNFMLATATDREIKKFTLAIGDVIITKDSETPGDIAVPAYVSEELGGVVCGYHLAILRPKKGKVDSEFLSHLLSMEKTRYYFFTLATGATRFGLSVGGIEKAHLNLPPFEEQQEIASVLRATDNEIETLQQKLNCLKQEKKALMQQLFTGKKRVKVN